MKIFIQSINCDI